MPSQKKPAEDKQSEQSDRPDQPDRQSGQPATPVSPGSPQQSGQQQPGSQPPAGAASTSESGGQSGEQSGEQPGGQPGAPSPGTGLATTSPGDEESEAQGMTWDELAPTPPAGIVIHPLDPDVVVSPVEVFVPEGEDTPDVDAAAINSDVDYNADVEDIEPFEADDVQTLQVVAATSGAILVINGNAYGFNGDGVNTLSRLLARAVTAAHF